MELKLIGPAGERYIFFCACPCGCTLVLCPVGLYQSVSLWISVAPRSRWSRCSRNSWFRLVLSVSFVINLENVLGFWCVVLARSTTSISNLSSGNYNIANLSRELIDEGNNFIAFWLVHMMRWPDHTYEFSSKTAHDIDRHSLWVVESIGLALAIVRDQYPFGMKVNFSCSCSTTYCTLESDASVTTVYRPLARGRAAIGGFGGSVFKFFYCSLLGWGKRGEQRGLIFSWSLVEHAATLEKCEAKWKNTLLGPKKDISPVGVVESFSLDTAAVVAYDGSSLPDRMM